MIHDTMNKREKQIGSISFDEGYGSGILASSIVLSFIYLLQLENDILLMFTLTLWGSVYLFKPVYDKKKLKNGI